VVFKSTCWRPSGVRLLGDKPLENIEDGRAYPSDHCGVLASFCLTPRGVQAFTSKDAPIRKHEVDSCKVS